MQGAPVDNYRQQKEKNAGRGVKIMPKQ
jgi:hypothetical protein